MIQEKIQSTAWQRSVILVILSVSYLLAFTQRTGPGLISSTLQAQFEVSGALLGTVASIQYLLYMTLQIPVGYLGDRLGPERMFSLGVLLDGIGTIVFASAHSFVWLLLGRGIVGFGDALIWVNIVLILGKWFLPKQFGSFLSVVSTAGYLGALVATIPLAAWMKASGWQLPFATIGVFLVVFGLLDCAVLCLSRKKRVDDKDVMLRTQLARHGFSQLISIVFRDRLAWATFACHFGAVGTYVGFSSMWAIPFFMQAYDIDRIHAAVFTLVGFVGGLFGGPLAGMVSDRLASRRLPYLVLQSMSTVAWMLPIFFDGRPPVLVSYVMMSVIGFGGGGSVLTFASIRDTTPVERSGITSGFANTGGFLSAVLLPVVFGAVLDLATPVSSAGASKAHAYAIAFVIPALFSAIGVLGTWLLPRTHQPLPHDNRAVSLREYPSQ